MKFIDLARLRRSVRRYSGKPISRADIEKCLEACRLAPSAQNSQPWRFAVIAGPEQLEKFSKAVFAGVYAATSFAAKASAIVVLLSRRNFVTHILGRQVQGIDFWMLDMGIGGEHLVLQARELGIGTCWIGWFNQKAAAKFVGLRPGWKIAGLIAMGYPADKAAQGNEHRKPLKELIYKWMEQKGDG